MVSGRSKGAGWLRSIQQLLVNRLVGSFSFHFSLVFMRWDRERFHNFVLFLCVGGKLRRQKTRHCHAAVVIQSRFLGEFVSRSSPVCYLVERLSVGHNCGGGRHQHAVPYSTSTLHSVPPHLLTHSRSEVVCAKCTSRSSIIALTFGVIEVESLRCSLQWSVRLTQY